MRLHGMVRNADLLVFSRKFGGIGRPGRWPGRLGAAATARTADVRTRHALMVV